MPDFGRASVRRSAAGPTCFGSDVLCQAADAQPGPGWRLPKALDKLRQWCRTSPIDLPASKRALSALADKASDAAKLRRKAGHQSRCLMVEQAKSVPTGW